MRRLTDRKGYITIEAALILPVFIIAVLSLGYYVKIYSLLENVSYSVTEEAALLASKAYIVKEAPLFRSQLKERIKEDNGELDHLEIKNFRYLYDDGDVDDLISVTAKYNVRLDLPVISGHTIEMESRIKCRGFTGYDGDSAPMSFDEMEKEGVWEPVWIFPMRGEKFHGYGCTYIRANAREMVLTKDLQKRYLPCGQCHADTASLGSLVYCFPKEGTAYHLFSCRHVDRYTIEISRGDALKKGYMPCSKCGGE